MRNSYNAVLLVLVLVFAAGFAHAQNMPDTPVTKVPDPILPNASNDNGARQLMQFAANNDKFDNLISDDARTLYKRQIPECQAYDQGVRQLPTPYGGLTFPATTSVVKFPAPINGIWVEHVKVRGCGNIYQINMMGIGRMNDEPIVLGLLPGETLSDPGQQGNVIHMTAQAIRRADANCSDDPKPVYTRMLGYKQPDGSMGRTDAKQGWFEEWKFRFCQKEIPAQIAFLPDGSGGYDIKTRLVGDIPATPAPKPVTQQKAPEPAPSAPLDLQKKSLPVQ